MVESWASSPGTRRSMQANRGRDTGPEMALRRLLHARGLRYRVCTRPLPERRHQADIVFRPARVAVEVRGCFWHGCPQHYRAPAKNSTYWRAKAEGNIARDGAAERALAAAGWQLIVVWEHENPADAADRVADAVCNRRRQPSSRARDRLPQSSALITQSDEKSSSGNVP